VNRVIKGVHIVPMGFANAFLIEGDNGLTLIDAGFPGKESAVFGAIRRLAAGFGHGRPIARDASTLFRDKWGERDLSFHAQCRRAA